MYGQSLVNKLFVKILCGSTHIINSLYIRLYIYSSQQQMLLTKFTTLALIDELFYTVDKSTIVYQIIRLI